MLLSLSSLDDALTLPRTQLWSVPTALVIATVMLCCYMGPSGLVGILIMLLSLPLNAFIATKLGAFTHKTMILRDKRVEFMTELLQA